MPEPETHTHKSIYPLPLVVFSNIYVITEREGETEGSKRVVQLRIKTVRSEEALFPPPLRRTVCTGVPHSILPQCSLGQWPP